MSANLTTTAKLKRYLIYLLAAVEIVSQGRPVFNASAASAVPDSALEKDLTVFKLSASMEFV